MNTPIFLINTVHPDANDFYKSHSTYNSDDSGLDLFIIEDLIIGPNTTEIVDLGIKCQLCTKSFIQSGGSEDNIMSRVNRIHTVPDKYHSYLLYPRSSISRTPLRLANSIGLIDSGYLGNLKVALWNTSDTPFQIKKGERYVQLVKADLSPIKFELVDKLRNTERGNGGFGSTGQ